jgi:tetratricopeptide (TPR) repeat protein
MDLTTLAAALFVALGLIGADAVMTANNVVVEVVVPPRGDKISIDDATLELAFESQLQAIAEIQSLVDPPEIRASRKQGIGMALAEAARVQGVAYALQTEFGYRPDRLRMALFMQDGAVKAVVSGSGKGSPAFEHVIAPHPNEELTAFVRRAAVLGGSHLAPYMTTLYLLQAHSKDKDFTDVLALADQAQRGLPPTPVSFQRSLYQNARGIVMLFQNDPKAAKAAFASAVASDPSNAAAVLNLAFCEVQLDEDARAGQRMESLIKEAPPTNPVLLATVYMTWAAAEMGQHDAARADALLQKALQLYPTSSTGYDLWAEAKELLGDHDAAAALRHKALAATDQFENYAEVAALYFHLAWQDNQPITRNKFANPTAVTFH